MESFHPSSIVMLLIVWCIFSQIIHYIINQIKLLLFGFDRLKYLVINKLEKINKVLKSRNSMISSKEHFVA